MPLELGVWRIDKELKRLEAGRMDQEERLEDILQRDITIASPNWLVIGRQVPTDHGGFIDLLAMDRDGHLIVLELKRDKTPREVVAQLLDYGSWVRTLKDEDIASVFEAFLKKYHSGQAKTSLDETFCKHFSLKEMPEVLNEMHELVVVAAALDPSTERIVSYLSGVHQVPINAVFFRTFKDSDAEYLTRAWFIEPTMPDAGVSIASDSELWNGEYYVSFGQALGREWEDARKYGYVSAGGGQWYSGTLRLLEPGARVWVNVPGRGYVAVGEVTGTALRISEFMVKGDDGTEVPISQVELRDKRIFQNMDDDNLSEYLVPVKWIKTLPVDQAIREKGFFGNQNTVCKPTTKKWNHTIDRLKQRFGLK
jgi:hypothetical protein